MILYSFLKILNSAQGIFDMMLLIINVATFYYIKNFYEKRIRKLEKNQKQNIDEFKNEFKKLFDEKLQHEAEKIQMKITFLDELINEKLQQEKITRELTIKGLSDSFKAISKK